MATTLLEMQQAWRDYVQNTMVVTVTRFMTSGCT